MATMENDKATISKCAHQIRPLSLTPLQNTLSISTKSFHRSAEEIGQSEGSVEKHLTVNRFFQSFIYFHCSLKWAHTQEAVQHLKTTSKIHCLPAVRLVP